MATITLYQGYIYKMTVNNGHLFTGDDVPVSFVCNGKHYGSVVESSGTISFIAADQSEIDVVYSNGVWTDEKYRYLFALEYWTGSSTTHYGGFEQHASFDETTLVRDRTLSDVQYAKALIAKGQDNWTAAEIAAWQAGQIKGIWQTRQGGRIINSGGDNLGADGKRLFDALNYATYLLPIVGVALPSVIVDNYNIAYACALEYYNQDPQGTKVGAPLLETIMAIFENNVPWAQGGGGDPQNVAETPSIDVFAFNYTQANHIEDRIYRYISVMEAVIFQVSA